LRKREEGDREEPITVAAEQRVAENQKKRLALRTRRRQGWDTAVITRGRDNAWCRKQKKDLSTRKNIKEGGAKIETRQSKSEKEGTDTVVTTMSKLATSVPRRTKLSTSCKRRSGN